jgi:DNA-binding CsgD family transcriptional regulator
LYQKLLVAGGLPLAECPTPLDEAAAELVSHGFARESHDREPRLVPVEPTLALDNAILAVQRRIVAEQAAVVRARQQLDTLRQTYLDAGFDADGRGLTRVVTEPAEIRSAAAELCMSAQFQILNVQTWSGDQPLGDDGDSLLDAARERGARLRSLCPRVLLDVPDCAADLRRRVADGWEVRVVDEQPEALTVADRTTALIPLDRTLSHALLVNAPAVVGLLVLLFERLWARALPVTAPSSGPPVAAMTPTQHRVLRLLLTGMTDAAIARHLQVSERTVRRHVSTLLDLLGASNRVSAAVMALREGWVE